MKKSQSVRSSLQTVNREYEMYLQGVMKVVFSRGRTIGERGPNGIISFKLQKSQNVSSVKLTLLALWQAPFFPDPGLQSQCTCVIHIHHFKAIDEYIS